MTRASILLLIGLCCTLVGCNTGEVGRSQIDQAYPDQNDDDIRSTLAQEDPDALRAYEEGKARDAAVEAQNSQIDGSNQGGQR